MDFSKFAFILWPSPVAIKASSNGVNNLDFCLIVRLNRLVCVWVAVLPLDLIDSVTLSFYFDASSLDLDIWYVLEVFVSESSTSKAQLIISVLR